MSKWVHSVETGDFSHFYTVQIRPLPAAVLVSKFHPTLKHVYIITDATTRRQLQARFSQPVWKQHYQITFGTKKYINTGCAYTSHYQLPKFPAWVLERCQPICIINPKTHEILSVTKDISGREIADLLVVYQDW